MAWDLAGPAHYGGDPATSQRDAVRFAYGDTDSTDLLCSDSEIAAALTTEGSVQAAAAAMCEHLARRFAREADKDVGQPGGLTTRYRFSQRSAAFATLGKELRALIITQGSKLAVPIVGGVSRATIDAARGNQDRVGSPFTQNQFDNVGSAPFRSTE
jgi:hypothetical protein